MQKDGAMAIPENARAAAAAILSPLPQDTQEIFLLRLERWWPDVISGLTDLYTTEQVEQTAIRLVEMAARAYVERDPELRTLDLRRQLRQDWLQLPSMVGYAGYTERFAGDLPASRTGSTTSVSSASPTCTSCRS